MQKQLPMPRRIHTSRFQLRARDATIRDMYVALGKRCFFTVGLFCIFLVPHISFAAELVFTPAIGTFTSGSDFSIKVSINPGTTTVNAADGVVSFDKDLLSVVSVSKDGSAFSLWTADPSFSNSAGTVTFSGGTPTAFSSQGTVVTIKFKAKAVGIAAVSISKGSILAADGKGTDVYVAGSAASYKIGEAAPQEEKPPEGEAAAFAEDTPDTPTITSTTHPKPEIWYATSTVDFTWKITPDVTGVRTGLLDKAEATPSTNQAITATTFVKSGVKDGTWYAYVQFRNELGWGKIGQRTVLIDTVPPEDFDFTIIDGDTPAPKFSYQASDALSGIDRYEIVIEGTVAATVRPQDQINGASPVPVQAGGAVKVAIRAIDKAGNIREVQKDMTLPAVVKATKGKVQEEEEKESIWSLELILAILFAMIIGAVAAWNVYMRKMSQQEKTRILHEVTFVRDKNDKIFSAMREEFEEMINDLDEKPQLTPAERDFMEKMKEALEISEELIDASMEELKKIIRG